jgi:ribosomal protein S19
VSPQSIYVISDTTLTMTTKEWTQEDEKTLKELRRRKAKVIRDKNRKRQYVPRMVGER